MRRTRHGDASVGRHNRIRDLLKQGGKKKLVKQTHLRELFAK